MSLELGRKPGESIVFPTLGIEVTVREPRRGKRRGKSNRGRVRLGVDAPRDVPILRGEMCGGRPTVAAERAGTAQFRVVWCDGSQVKITTRAAYWTAVQAHRGLAARQYPAEVVADTESAAVLAAALGEHCCEVMAGAALTAARGDGPRPRPRGELAGWTELATRLGAIAPQEGT